MYDKLIYLSKRESLSNIFLFDKQKGAVEGSYQLEATHGRNRGVRTTAEAAVKRTHTKYVFCVEEERHVLPVWWVLPTVNLYGRSCACSPIICQDFLKTTHIVYIQ